MKNKLQSIIKHIKTMFYNLKLCVSLKKDNSTKEKDLCEKEKCGKFEKNIYGMPENMRKHINDFRTFFRRKKEETLSEYLKRNDISTSKKSLMFYDFRKEQAFLHFDNTYYYIIYCIDGEYEIKKKELSSAFDYDVIDKFGRFFLIIKGVKAPLPITEQLFYGETKKLIDDNIKAIRNV